MESTMNPVHAGPEREMTDVPLSPPQVEEDGIKGEVGDMKADRSPFGKRDMSTCALNAAFLSVKFERKCWVERNMIKVDESIVSICDEPGMFNVAWAVGFVDPPLILLVTSVILVQILTPAMIVVPNLLGGDSRVAECIGATSEESNWEIRLVCGLLTGYLVTQLIPSIDRAEAFVVMGNVVEGMTSAHTVGACVLYGSCYLTMAATFILFLKQPSVPDMLLNCVALAFLPEVDRAMVTIAKSVRPSVVDVAQRKLEIFRRDWPDSVAREKFLEFQRLGTCQGFRLSAATKSLEIFYFVTLFLIMSSIFFNTVCIDESLASDDF